MRWFVLLLCAVALMGCDRRDTRTTEEIEAEARATAWAKAELAIYNHESAQRSVAWAAACDFAFPSCPRSVTARGREFARQGVSGGTWLFPVLVGVKLVVVALFLGTLAGAGWGASGVAAAWWEGSRAHARGLRAQARIDEADRTEARIGALQHRLGQLQHELEQKQELIEACEKKLRELKAHDRLSDVFRRF